MDKMIKKYLLNRRIVTSFFYITVILYSFPSEVLAIAVPEVVLDEQPASVSDGLDSGTKESSSQADSEQVDLQVPAITEATQPVIEVADSINSSKGWSINKDVTTTITLNYQYNQGTEAVLNPQAVIDLGVNFYYVPNTLKLNQQAVADSYWTTPQALALPLQELSPQQPTVSITFEIIAKVDPYAALLIAEDTGINYSLQGTNYVGEQKKYTMRTIPLEVGWFLGMRSDTQKQGQHAIGWSNESAYLGYWLYSYKNNPSITNSYQINTTLIENGLLLGPHSGKGMFQSKGQFVEYFINPYPDTKQLLVSINFLGENNYRVDITQKLLPDGSAEISYRVLNRSGVAQVIGLSQILGTNFEEIIPLNSFNGVRIGHPLLEDMTVATVVDPKTFPNWASGSLPIYTTNFNQFSSQQFDGVGWETGYRYATASGVLLNEPQSLSVNQPLVANGAGIIMKNPGVSLAPNESYEFKFVTKMGGFSAPTLTVNQTSGELYRHGSFSVTGQVSDQDNQAYQLYLQLPDTSQPLIKLAEFQQVPEGDVVNYHGTIQGSDLAVGEQEVQIIAIDEYGTRSTPQPLRLKVSELTAEPIPQYVAVNASLDSSLNQLFRDIKGEEVVLKEPITVDSSQAGFQWEVATLQDKYLEESQVKIPVSVYDPVTTTLDKTNHLALDAKPATLTVAEVESAILDGTLAEKLMVQFAVTSWTTDTGLMNEVKIVSNPVKAQGGKYLVTLEAMEAKNKHSLKKEVSVLVTGGELAFDSIPSELAFKPVKISSISQYVERSDAQWAMIIKNTLGVAWTLSVQSSPFVNAQNDVIHDALIYRDPKGQETILNQSSQRLIQGDAAEAYQTITWAANQGLLLKIPSSAMQGDYKSTITWTLQNTPNK